MRNTGVDYTALDQSIIAAIKGGCSESARIVKVVDAVVKPFGEFSVWRIVGQRLQSLRKRGLIAYTPGGGWAIKEQS